MQGLFYHHRLPQPCSEADARQQLNRQPSALGRLGFDDPLQVIQALDVPSGKEVPVQAAIVGEIASIYRKDWSVTEQLSDTEAPKTGGPLSRETRANKNRLFPPAI